MKTNVQPANPPVRNIVPGPRGVTGKVPHLGKYESTLERDFMEILRFDPNIEEFTPQPLKLEFIDKEGKKRSYTPDGLIKFKSTSLPTHDPILFEVKYRADFRKDWKILVQKYRAAKLYCIPKGWRFRVYTECEIRTQYLINVRFLAQFQDRKPDAGTKAHILQILEDLDSVEIDVLLFALCKDKTNRAMMIPYVWHLVANGDIDCDLDLPLNMQSILIPCGEDENA